MFHHVEEGHKVVGQAFGQSRVEESLENVLVVGVAQCELVEFVGVHELVEDVGAQHNRFGDDHFKVVVLVDILVFLDNVVDERQSASFPAERPLTNAGEVAVLVEPVAVEHGHDAPVSHLAVGDDGIEDVLPVLVHVLQSLVSDFLKKFRDGEQCPGAEPA